MTNKRKKILVTTAFSLMAAASLVHAADPTSPAVESFSASMAVQELGNKIDSLAKAQVRMINRLAYELDKSFIDAIDIINKQDDIQSKTRAMIHQESDSAVKQTLLPFAAKTLTYTNKNQPEVQKINAQSEKQDKSARRLKNIEASDSIFSLVQGIEASSFWTRKNLSAPERNDDAFNFANLIEPDLYTVEQEKNSKDFIAFVTKQYISYTDNINLSQLRDALNNYKNRSPKVLGQKINEFRNNPTYNNYQTTIRSLTASKSVANDILIGLAAERRPIRSLTKDPQLETLSRAVGVEPRASEIPDPDNDGQKITLYTYASPQQIAKYQANHDKAWYQEVATDSMENLQRKSLLVQDQISKQLYRNHLDNEKIMAALAMSLLQTNDMGELNLKTQANDVNAAIKTFYDSSTNKDSSTSNTTTTNTSSDTGNNDITDKNKQDAQDAANNYNNGSYNSSDYNQ